MNYPNKQKLISENIRNTDVVLDVGFVGQGVTESDPNWVHNLLKKSAKEVYGIDLDFDATQFPEPYYLKQSAESFDFPVKFDVIFAGDLIEHLSNPGLFLDSCKRNLKQGGGCIILTTPNCYNLFNIASKLTRYEPITNKDHTCYFNVRTLHQLMGKNGLQVTKDEYLYTLEIDQKESMKKKFLNVAYFVLSKFTDKYLETIVVTVTVK